MQYRLVCVLVSAIAFCLASFQGASATSRDARGAVEKENALAAEFEGKGMKLGSPVFIRIYKQSSTLELWVEKGPRYELFKTYGICKFAGGLGPKMYEGDRQSPEGLYRVEWDDLIGPNPRWHRAMNINYPNAFDKMNGRGGSSILIHGKCSSIGCFAIQDANVEEVYDAVRAALRGGQSHVPVLALPFRFAKYAPELDDTRKLNEFWSDLRRADLLFDRDRLPPMAYVCDNRYYFADRRGDKARHAVQLPGCKPLEKQRPAPRQDEASNASDNIKPVGIDQQPKPEAPAAMPTMPTLHKVSNENGQRGSHVLKAAISSKICPLKFPHCKQHASAHVRYAKLTIKAGAEKTER
ncbi:ErfK/YbiS/YcfS/YnhG family protein [Rhodomicrobium vannielii ATCC 17100]|uniref:ErfK/YbiS/YcfS/YnhG family protein n=2 Tax=Rhodomicrobium vannielii TaxID=1069 RepID=E3HYX0_RHOVT|nr:ErfK/YbiS/YcfS/YnhG family protein [Rhodomicrobium vannielii ATCC 17100]